MVYFRKKNRRASKDALLLTYRWFCGLADTEFFHQLAAVCFVLRSPFHIFNTALVKKFLD